jgi:hypothetical protein
MKTYVARPGFEEKGNNSENLSQNTTHFDSRTPACKFQERLQRVCEAKEYLVKY